MTLSASIAQLFIKLNVGVSWKIQQLLRQSSTLCKLTFLLNGMIIQRARKACLSDRLAVELKETKRWLCHSKTLCLLSGLDFCFLW